MNGLYVAAGYIKLLVEYCENNIQGFVGPESAFLKSVKNALEPIPLEFAAPYVTKLLDNEPNALTAWKVGTYFVDNHEDMYVYSIVNSSDIAEGNKIALQYYRLITNVVTMEMEAYGKNGSIARIRVRDEATPVSLFIVEVLSSMSLQLFLRASGLEINKIALVEDACSFAELIDKISSSIPASDISYSRGNFVSVLPTEMFETPNKDAQPRLKKALLQELENRLEDISVDEGWHERVRKFVKLRLQQSVTLDDACDYFHLSRRTMSRLLAKEGRSFKKIVDEIRRERALELIERDIPLKKVAAQSGFNSTSTFASAFKGWTGSSPKIYRNTQQKPG